jgi:hypothetical protein
MSHGGVQEPTQGPIVEGDDVTLAQAVREIDVIVRGAYSHFPARTNRRERYAEYT